MNLNELSEKIDQVGLTHRKTEILALALPRIALHAVAVRDERCLAAHGSRIGGLPALPAEFTWPIWRNQPLEFLAQLNMAEVAVYDPEAILPHQGMLYFFYNPLQWTEGDPYEDGMYRVLFFDNDLSALKLSSRPSNLNRVFALCSIDFDVEFTLPAPESLLAEARLPWVVKDTPDQRSDARSYRDLLYDYSDEAAHDWSNAMLGHPDLIQQDVFEEAYWAKNNPSSGRGRRPLQYTDIENWRLLLQIDSVSEADMMWGDVGTLYYCIEKDALQARSFDEVVVIMQSC